MNTKRHSVYWPTIANHIKSWLICIYQFVTAPLSIGDYSKQEYWSRLPDAPLPQRVLTRWAVIMAIECHPSSWTPGRTIPCLRWSLWHYNRKDNHVYKNTAIIESYKGGIYLRSGLGTLKEDWEWQRGNRAESDKYIWDLAKDPDHQVMKQHAMLQLTSNQICHSEKFGSKT